MQKTKILIFIFLLNSFAFSNSFKVIDVLDRKITLTKPIKKVIALGTSLSFVTYLNAQDMVIGVEAIEKKDVKKRTYTYVNRKWINSLPIVGEGGKAKRPNLEAIKFLNPDIIFTITQDKNEADLLSKQLDIPVVVVGYGVDTIDFADVYKSLELIGDILDKEKRAEELISYIKKIQTEFKEIDNPQKAYMGAIAYKGLRGITSTQVDFMPFNLVNITNIVSGLQDKGKISISKEYLLVNNPPMIFLDYTGLELVKNEFEKNNGYFNRLDAFKNTVYITLPNTFYYINLDQMLANSFFMAKVVYPEYYKDLDPVKKADEVFINFVGEPLYKMIREDTGGFQTLELKNNKFHLKSI